MANNNGRLFCVDGRMGKSTVCCYTCTGDVIISRSEEGLLHFHYSLRSNGISIKEEATELVLSSEVSGLFNYVMMWIVVLLTTYLMI